MRISSNLPEINQYRQRRTETNCFCSEENAKDLDDICHDFALAFSIFFFSTNALPLRHQQDVIELATHNRSIDKGSDVDWDKLEFGVVQTNYMYVMKCAWEGKFSSGEINRYGNIEMNPASGVLNYGQVCIHQKNSDKLIAK